MTNTLGYRPSDREAETARRNKIARRRDGTGPQRPARREPHDVGAASIEHAPVPYRSPWVGRVLVDTYRIERLIGDGGMGAVFEASHTRLPRRFAVKILSPGVASNTEAVARFRREAEITSAMGHPNIVEGIDFNHAPDGTPYLVMEFLDGEDLEQRLRRLEDDGSRLDPRELAIILRDTASAVQAAHDRGIVHRDLKPSNVFLAKGSGGIERVKVLDFGISKILGAAASLTCSERFLGTPGFTAPEQAMGRSSDIDGRTDIFAAGGIAYRALCGNDPFSGDSVHEVLYKVVHEAVPSLADLRPDLPAPVVAVVDRALAKDPDERYQTMSELACAFCEAVGITAEAPAIAMAQLFASPAPRPMASRPPAPPVPAQQTIGTLSELVGELRVPRRSWVWSATAVCVVGAIAAAGVVAFTQAPDRRGAVAPAEIMAAKAPPRAPELPSVEALVPVEAARTPRRVREETKPRRAQKRRARRAASRSKKRRRSKRARRRRERAKVATAMPAPSAPAARTELRIGTNAGGTFIWADVLVDGRRRGKTPTVVRDLEPGVHEIIVRKKGYRTIRKRVALRAGQKRTVLLDLAQ